MVRTVHTCTCTYGIKYNTNASIFDRLRELLTAEEQQYQHEMESAEETVIERQAKMRDRAKSLKEKRETERLALVQGKLEQQWR